VNDIYPGMVMCKTSGENTTLYAGPATVGGFSAAVPWGLAELFVAPILGIDEVALSNTNLMTVWRGGPQFTCAILAPAFDPNASWVNATTGARQLIAATTGVSGSSSASTGPGKITPFVPANYYATNQGCSEPIGQLISVDGPTQITVNFNPELAFLSTAAVAALTSPTTSVV